MPHTYFLSSLCVNLCFAKADALPNTLLQTCLEERKLNFISVFFDDWEYFMGILRKSAPYS